METSVIDSAAAAAGSSGSPALSVAIAVLAVLLGLTGFGIYTAFGPPSKELSDPFDDHDD
jgi:PsbN protein